MALRASLVSLVFALAVLFVPHLQAATLDPSLIIPGKSLGLLQLGIKIRAVLDAWGPPSKLRYTNPPDSNVLRFVGTYEYGQFRIFITAVCGWVSGAKTWSPDYRTEKGIRVGDAVDKVVSTYGRNYQLDATSDGMNYIGYSGIAFIYDSSRRVREISIGDGKLADEQVRVGAFDPFRCDRGFESL